jgi:hypothetical protein
MTVAEVTCAACGTGLPPNSKFCNECGAAVSATTKSAEYKQVRLLPVTPPLANRLAWRSGWNLLPRRVE